MFRQRPLLIFLEHIQNIYVYTDYICINPNISTSCWVFSLNTFLIHIAEAADGTTPSIYQTSSRLSEEGVKILATGRSLMAFWRTGQQTSHPKFVWFCAFLNYHQKIIINSHPDSNKIKIIDISNIKNPNCIIPIWWLIALMVDDSIKNFQLSNEKVPWKI